MEKESEVQFPILAAMALSHMDSLCKIWTDGPLETLTFEHLQYVKAWNCKSLENLFPHWVATSITQLNYLRVKSCMIEYIVASGDDISHSNTAQVLFPKLTSLVLHDMPRLKSFCPNLPTLSWPLLEDLRVTQCDKVNILSFVALMNNGTQRNDQQELSNQEAHSSLEKDFPMLERLSLVDKDISMIQDGKFPEDIFDKAEALTLACFHDEKQCALSPFPEEDGERDSIGGVLKGGSKARLLLRDAKGSLHLLRSRRSERRRSVGNCED
ncbi:hypothetical protein BT93_B1314 [Corymbia citriodora subsp. variegata]|nr:hypothetical protein BT93_B1314 [Corymbia citriodora subsp. variegata]